MQEPGSTCYAGVQELEGGQMLTAGAEGTVRVRTYWSAPAPTPYRFRRPEEAVDAFVPVFREATRARLRSNRRVGVFLSGGLDSSYVAAVAVRAGAAPPAITAYAPGTRWLDERRHARLAARHLGLLHQELDISDCWALSSRYLPDHLFDEPAHPPQSPHMMRLAAAARDAGMGVMLGGEGGDEWLNGDDRFVADAVVWGRLRTGWRLARTQAQSRPVWKAFGRECFYGLTPLPVQAAAARLRRRVPAVVPAAAVASDPRWVQPADRLCTAVWRRGRLRLAEWQVYRDATRPVVGWRDRHALSANGIELRTPFNDLRVIELLAAVPEWMKRHQGRTKDVLRAAFDGHLPAGLAGREDKGYFNELVTAGMTDREWTRAQAAAAAAADFPGVSAGSATAEISRWRQVALTARHPAWIGWQPSWRIITAGLWLQSLDVLRSCHIQPAARGIEEPHALVLVRR
jgi:asparagine synthase (glutamine-hydrolysing)